MSLASVIVKEFSGNKDKLINILIGNTIDEYGNKYEEEYSSELNSFFSEIERVLTLLEENKVEINKEVLKSQIITNWFNHFESSDLKELDIYLMDVLTFSKEKIKAAESLNLSKKENLLLSKTIRDEIDRNKKILINLSLDRKDQTTLLLLDFKEKDTAHYESVIENIKDSYIKLLNLLYKLYGEQPKDWSTGLSLHEAVCRDFSIKREEFMF